MARDVQIGQKEKSDYEKEINMHNKHFGFGSSIM